jgi:hypothetical protein
MEYGLRRATAAISDLSKQLKRFERLEGLELLFKKSACYRR